MKQKKKIYVPNSCILVFIEPVLIIVQNWRKLQWPPVGERTDCGRVAQWMPPATKEE